MVYNVMALDDGSKIGIALFVDITNNKCMSSGILTPDDRQFFSLVSRAAFTNPFSEERASADALITGMEGISGFPEPERVARLLEGMRARLERLEEQKVGAFHSEDRQIMVYAWLFFYFHRYLDALDALIQRQMEAGDASVPVPFAKELLSSLRSRGFTREASLRFFALFYQLRRAYYFVEKSLVGRSLSMQQLRRSLWNSVFTHDIAVYDRYLWNRLEDFSTLLLGETGTGKGTAAAAIGRSGYIPFNERKGMFKESFTHIFLTINLSQHPENLIESELFGHRKGSFTGAVEDHKGIFSCCSGQGALFLDEIGEVSIPVQIKLLQVLQERTFSPVGSHEKLKFKGRVIGATNQPLERIRREGGFRDDFFYRLSSDVMTVPPLRQRLSEDPSELNDLILLTVKRIIGEPSPELASRVRETLDSVLPKDYHWPGNVRELEQAVRRILLTGTYRGEAPSTEPESLVALKRGIDSGSLTAKEMLEHYCTLLYSRFRSYEEVARKLKVDARTVKKHVIT
jgi:DNA-binding NtrC family response regulator